VKPNHQTTNMLYPMKTKNSVIALALIALATFNSQLSTTRAQSTAFTFQGALNSGAANANGLYDLRFAVFDANVAGNQIAGPATNTAVAISNGLFTVMLDFGAGIFTGTNYFVEMGVRTNGGGSFATLAPRQQLTPAPAAFSLSVQSPQFNSFCPVGSIIAYMGTNAPPGWLLCNGAIVPRSQYPALWAVIGNSSGGDNVSFRLPDTRGIFLRGRDAGQGRDPDAAIRGPFDTGGNPGDAVGSYQGDSFKQHTHTFGAGNQFLDGSGVPTGNWTVNGSDAN
jgi:microcystin-dependent protein